MDNNYRNMNDTNNTNNTNSTNNNTNNVNFTASLKYSFSLTHLSVNNNIVQG